MDQVQGPHPNPGCAVKGLLRRRRLRAINAKVRIGFIQFDGGCQDGARAFGLSASSHADQPGLEFGP